MIKRPRVPVLAETTFLFDKVVPPWGSAKHHLLQEALPNHTTILGALAIGFVYPSLRTQATFPSDSGWPCV